MLSSKTNNTETLSPGLSFDMIYVEGETFDMGSEDGLNSEKPIHKVSLDDFHIGKHPVTQVLWKAVMGFNPSFFPGDERPVESVSWDQAQAFIKKLNQETEHTYRLPTEAEWEYASRGGQLSKGFLYSGSNKLKEVGWFRENSLEETKVVGQKRPNELGLYDMSGNVWEWCQDWYSGGYYEECHKKGVVHNPQGPKRGVRQVVRGGGWGNASGRCRSTLRDGWDPEIVFSDIGFRLVFSPSSGSSFGLPVSKRS